METFDKDHKGQSRTVRVLSWNVKKRSDWKDKLFHLGKSFPGAIVLLQEAEFWPSTCEFEAEEGIPFYYVVLRPPNCKVALAFPEQYRELWNAQVATHGNSVGIQIGDVGLCASYFPESSYDTDVYAEEVQCAVEVLERLQSWGCSRLVWGGDAHVNLVDHGCD